MRLPLAKFGRARRHAGTRSLSPTARPADDLGGQSMSIDAWLKLLHGFLRAPRKEAAAICEELEDHLKDRTRDLMVGGMPEPLAARAAIEELGDAAAVADRYRRVGTHFQRRRLMQLSLFGLTGAALAMSIVAVTGSARSSSMAGAACPPGSEGVTAPQSAEEARSALLTLGALQRVQSGERANALTLLSHAQAQAQLNSLLPTGAQRATAQFFSASEQAGDGPDVKMNIDATEMRLTDLLEFVSAQVGGKNIIRWRTIQEDMCTVEDSLLKVKATDASLSEVFAAINDAIESDMDLAYRWHDNTLEIASAVYFDINERTLACYDLASLNLQDFKEVIEAIEAFVEPHGWENNGGTVAMSKVVGSKLFIEAPPRYHEQVRWIIDQLTEAPAAAMPTTPLAETQAEIPVLTDIPLISNLFSRQPATPTTPQ